MRRILLLMLVLFPLVAGAQNSVMMGQIVGDDDKPINGAAIRVCRGADITTVHADERGLFYTGLLAWGNYHVDVLVGGKLYKTARVYLGDNSRKKRFYHLKIADEKLQIVVDGRDPFLQSGLSVLETTDYSKLLLLGDHVFFVKKDTATGKMAPLYGDVSNVERPSKAW